MRRVLLLTLLIGCSGPQRAPEPVVDRDGDGVAEDRCVDAPEDVDGVEDADGCPDIDDDSDGIADTDDRCPCVPEDEDRFEDIDGCPDPDDDGDGIVDACDRCPREPESQNGVDDLDGCSDRALVRISGDRIVIVQHLQFARSSAEIPTDALHLLDEIANALRDFPQIRRIEVAGHASPDERSPHRLAQQRADAVREALIARGVDPSRLVARGYGAERPAESNDTPQGRERNRRVEWQILEADEPPPPPAPAPPCPEGPPPPPASRCDPRLR